MKDTILNDSVIKGGCCSDTAGASQSINLEQDRGESMGEQRKTSFSTKAILFHGERFLLLRKKERGNQGPWELPGGGVEFGEHPDQAVLREVREETGLAAHILGPATTWRYQKNAHEYLVGIIYIGTVDTTAVRLSHEHSDFRWITARELANFRIHPSLVESLQFLSGKRLLAAGELLQQYYD